MNSIGAQMHAQLLFRLPQFAVSHKRQRSLLGSAPTDQSRPGLHSMMPSSLDITCVLSGRRRDTCSLSISRAAVVAPLCASMLVALVCAWLLAQVNCVEYRKRCAHADVHFDLYEEDSDNASEDILRHATDHHEYGAPPAGMLVMGCPAGTVLSAGEQA